MWNRNENQIEMILLRHGKTISNEEKRYLGWREESLSEKGISELLEKKKAGKYMLHTGKEPTLILTSPMQRCLETGALLFEGINRIQIPEWKEMNFGDFEGKNYEELNGNAAYQAYIDSGGKSAFPNGETLAAFCNRTLEGLKKAEQALCLEVEAVKQDSFAGIVHGGTIMALMSAWTGKDYFSFQVKNGEGFRCLLQRKDGELRLEKWESL